MAVKTAFIGETDLTIDEGGRELNAGPGPVSETADSLICASNGVKINQTGVKIDVTAGDGDNVAATKILSSNDVEIKQIKAVVNVETNGGGKASTFDVQDTANFRNKISDSDISVNAKGGTATHVNESGQDHDGDTRNRTRLDVTDSSLSVSATNGGNAAFYRGSGRSSSTINISGCVIDVNAKRR